MLNGKSGTQPASREEPRINAGAFPNPKSNSTRLGAWAPHTPGCEQLMTQTICPGN